MYTHKVEKIVLADGTVVAPPRLTILVGANNVGKSRALREIVATAVGHKWPSLLVKKVVRTLPSSFSELLESYDLGRWQNDDGDWKMNTLSPELTAETQGNESANWRVHAQSRILAGDEAFFSEAFGADLTAFLTTASRLQLGSTTSSPAHERSNAGLLQALYNAGRSAELTLRATAKEVVGQEVALDFTVPQSLVLRVGPSFVDMPPDPRDAKPLMRAYQTLDEQGDGMRSFVAMALAFLVLKRPLFLVDEPEAFLHPPQAFRAGQFIASQASNGRQVVVATHSAEVVRGLLSNTQDAVIVRIERFGTANKFGIINTDAIRDIMRDPLLSSARVLDGLFYAGAVVVEADADARFYHSASNHCRPDLDLHFVNADNKQTVARIVAIYRAAGVRCVGIVDFDVLNDSAEFEKHVEAYGFDPSEIRTIKGVREDIAKAAKELPVAQRFHDVVEKLKNLAASVAARGQVESDRERSELLGYIDKRARELIESNKNWREFKARGRAALPEESRKSFDCMFLICARRGLLICPSGELETMLVECGLNYTTNKREWISAALPLVRNLSVDYNKQPWKFIKMLHDFIEG